jgi:hypothetical protein
MSSYLINSYFEFSGLSQPNPQDFKAVGLFSDCGSESPGLVTLPQYALQRLHH